MSASVRDIDGGPGHVSYGPQAHRRGIRARFAALLAVAALGVASCGSITGDSGNDDPGTPRRGGTLRLVGNGDVDHLDTASAYYVPSYRLFRAITRQLVSYPYSDDVKQATTPVADLAESIPEPTNNGLTWTFTIRKGARWDVGDNGRQITGDDVVRGIKRMCNPVSPSGAIGYYTDTIKGLAAYCAKWAKEAETTDATVASIQTFMAANDVEGVKADGRTVTFTLIRPASDFLNIMAMTFASPVPVEMMKYLPDSPEFRVNFISDGPYKIDRYIVNQSITLVRNGNWDSDTDPLRKAYVDQIEIVEGSDEGPVQKQIEAGTADLSWDTTVPSADIVRLLAIKDPRLTLEGDGSVQPYVVFNLQSPNAGRLLSDPTRGPLVRQAINWAIDKTFIAKLQGGSKVNTPLGQILTPEVLGPYSKTYNEYSNKNGKPDPSKAKSLMKQAGIDADVGEHVTLKYLYRNVNTSPRIYQAIQRDLDVIGIDLQPVRASQTGFYTDYLMSPESAERGDWDLAAANWVPDWYGNAGRSFFVPMLDGRHCGEGRTNYGCYNNKAVNKLIDQALQAKSEEQAAKLWVQADEKAMADAPWAPLIAGKTARYRSERVGGYKISLGTTGPDLTNLWLTRGD
jgi:peptide/nickel transport system substrate-binding protein